MRKRCGPRSEVLWGLALCLSMGLGACSVAPPGGTDDAELGTLAAAPANPTDRLKAGKPSGPNAVPLGPYLARYRKVFVADFSDEVSRAEPWRAAKMGEVVLRFSDLIAENLKGFNAFSEVSRDGTPDAETLVIGGTIKRLEEGNAMARFWIGFGAGSSRFEADVELWDGATGASIRSLEIDKSSLFTGGLIAAAQTTDGFEERAAAWVAEVVHQGKLGRKAWHRWHLENPPQVSGGRKRNPNTSRIAKFSATPSTKSDRLRCKPTDSKNSPATRKRPGSGGDEPLFDRDKFDRVVVLKFEEPNERQRFGSKFPRDFADRLEFDDEFEQVRWLAAPTAGELEISGSIACFEHPESDAQGSAGSVSPAATLEVNVEFRDGGSDALVGSRVYQQPVHSRGVLVGRPRFADGEILGVSFALAELFHQIGREISAMKRGQLTPAAQQMFGHRDGFRP